MARVLLVWRQDAQAMVAFETLLLGVIFGRPAIRLMVAPPVATVELRLDGTQIAVLRGPSWVAEYDFGSAPMPHELVAVGLDSSGREVGRATQWLNFGRQKAGVSVLLERDPRTGQPVTATVAWRAVDEAEPEAVTATLDGAPLAVADSRRIPLPHIDPTQPHLLSVEVVFPGDLRDRADLAFGGDVTDTTESELTAVPVVLPPNKKDLDLWELKGVFAIDGTAREPIATEKSRADVAVVVEKAAWYRMWKLRSVWSPEAGPRTLRPDRDRFYVFSTVAREVRGSGNVASIFPMSPPNPLSWLDDYGVLWQLEYTLVTLQEQTVANAAAVAAKQVAADNHRRAVVLLLGDAAPTSPGTDPRLYDGSTLEVAAARAYLTSLNVPLFVWSVAGGAGGPLTAAWGPAEDVSTKSKLKKAVKRLKAVLETQRIVWFSGRHLPQRITLDTAATSLRLAR